MPVTIRPKITVSHSYAQHILRMALLTLAFKPLSQKTPSRTRYRNQQVASDQHFSVSTMKAFSTTDCYEMVITRGIADLVLPFKPLYRGNSFKATKSMIQPTGSCLRQSTRCEHGLVSINKCDEQEQEQDVLSCGFHGVCGSYCK